MNVFTMNFRNPYWFFPLFLFSIFSAKAQSTLPIFAEPEVQVNVKTEGAWSYDFGISHRNLVYSEEFLFKEIQLEFTHMTGYAINDRNKVGLGIYYRFREIFSDSYQDEFRIFQQFNHTVKYNAVKTGHRFRFEERFRKKTSFRLRYRFSATFPLSSAEKERKWFLKAHTEALLAMADYASSAWDQRFGLGIKKEIGPHTDFSFGAEYKYEDYTHEPESELFFKMGVSIEL